MLSTSYESEQKKLQTEIQAYEKIQREQRKTDDDIDRFYALIDKYTNFEELTPAILNEFVEKILVHKAEKIDRERVQKVEVYLNFIGKIDFPQVEEPVDPEQAKIDKYWKDRYYNRREYELALRKKINARIGEQFEANRKADRDRIVKEFESEVETNGIESLPVIPARLRNGAAAR